MDPWWVYILRCKDGTLYCGMTNNVERRLHEHNHSVRGARYTRTRRPVRLVYVEGPLTRHQAHNREDEIKTFTHREKEALLALPINLIKV